MPLPTKKTTSTSKTTEKADKSVRFSADTDKKFSSLAEKLGRSKQELFAQMVDYFYKSKKDPIDLSDELLKKELSNGINRIISFIKTQEKDTLIPLVASSIRTEKQLKDQGEKQGKFSQWLVNLFRTDGKAEKGNYWEMLTTSLQLIADTTANTYKILTIFQKEQQQQMKTKAELKEAFTAVLVAYMEERERYNSITQSGKIQELQQKTAQAIEHI